MTTFHLLWDDSTLKIPKIIYELQFGSPSSFEEGLLSSALECMELWSVGVIKPLLVFREVDPPTFDVDCSIEESEVLANPELATASCFALKRTFKAALQWVRAEQKMPNIWRSCSLASWRHCSMAIWSCLRLSASQRLWLAATFFWYSMNWSIMSRLNFSINLQEKNFVNGSPFISFCK